MLFRSVPTEVDAKNGNGWFWNTSADANVKTSQQLFNIYLSSVGRNSNLILNFPPNRAGRLSDATVDRMRGMKTLLDAAFTTDLAAGKPATATAVRASSVNGKFAPSNVTDGNSETYWALEDGVKTGSIDVDLGANSTVTYVRLAEHIRLGQRVKGFEISTWNGSAWVKQTLTESATTIGHKRIVKLTTPVSTSKVRVTITDSKDCPLISRVSVY